MTSVESAIQPQRERRFQLIPKYFFPWGRVLLVLLLDFVSASIFLILTSSTGASSLDNVNREELWEYLFFGLVTIHASYIAWKSDSYSRRIREFTGELGKTRIWCLGKIEAAIILLAIFCFSLLTLYVRSMFLSTLALYVLLMTEAGLSYCSARSPSLRWALSRLIQRDLDGKFFAAVFLSGLILSMLSIASYVTKPSVAFGVASLSVLLATHIFFISFSKVFHSEGLSKYVIPGLFLFLLIFIDLFLIYYYIPLLFIYLQSFISSLPSIADFLLQFGQSLSDFLHSIDELLTLAVPGGFTWALDRVSSRSRRRVYFLGPRWCGSNLLLSVLVDSDPGEVFSVHGDFIALRDPPQLEGGFGKFSWTSGEVRLAEVLIGSALSEGFFVSDRRGLPLRASLDLSEVAANVGVLTVLVTFRCTSPSRGIRAETHVVLVKLGEEKVEELFVFEGEPSKLKPPLSRAEPQATH